MLSGDVLGVRRDRGVAQPEPQLRRRGRVVAARPQREAERAAREERAKAAVAHNRAEKELLKKELG